MRTLTKLRQNTWAVSDKSGTHLGQIYYDQGWYKACHNEVVARFHSLEEAVDHLTAGEFDRYSEKTMWVCLSKNLGTKTTVNGALAQILKKYPDDYQLELFSC